MEGTIEAGSGLIGPMQGKGLAEMAMRAALGPADEHRPGARFTCIIQPDNAASLHVAMKLGFAEFARTEDRNNPVILMDRRRRSFPLLG